MTSDELKKLSDAATPDMLSDGGRYFDASVTNWHSNLTECGHGDTGKYLNSADGKFIEEHVNE